MRLDSVSVGPLWSSLPGFQQGPRGGRPQPWYLVAAGLGARLAHGEPEGGAGREKPALFAVGDHLLGLPVTHHLHLHVLRVLQAEGLGPGWGGTVGREESRLWGIPGAGATRRFKRRLLKTARPLLGCLAWGTPKDLAILRSPGSEEGALQKYRFQGQLCTD